VLKNGVWHYRPELPPQPVLRLAHSPHVGGYVAVHRDGLRAACRLPAGDRQ
jgi:hypothetical protein